MKRALALVLAVVLLGAASRGGEERGGAVRSTAPVARSAPQVSRPAPPAPAPARPAAPARAPAPPAGGFNFNHDITQPAPPRPAPAARQAPQAPRQAVAPQQRAVPQRGPAPAQRAAAPSYRRPPNAPGTGPYSRFAGPVVRNPHPIGNTWGWNHGVAWRPATPYWGGGFWGPWALAALAGATLFGAIVNDSAQIEYPSYEVEPDSPGAQLLQNYELQQTQCGPPGLVVIWGPDNSVICAFPNATVAAGNYEVDPTTLDLVSQ